MSALPELQQKSMMVMIDDEDWFSDDEEDETDQLEKEAGEEYVIIGDTDSDYLQTSPEVLINDGRSRMSAQSRFRRFRCVSNVRLKLWIECKVNDGSCKIFQLDRKVN